MKTRGRLWSGRSVAILAGLVFAMAGSAMVALANSADPATKAVMQGAAQCAQQNLDGRYSVDGRTAAAGHELAKKLETELNYQYSNSKPSKKSTVTFCILNTTQNVALVAKMAGPGRISSSWDIGPGKCIRRSTINFRPNVSDAYAKQKNIDAKYLRTAALMHEWRHAFEERPIEKYLSKLGMEGADSLDPPGSKGRAAWDLAEAALHAEEHINQFENVYEELCDVIENCKIKRGTVVAAKKKQMNAKLKDICERLGCACRQWDAAYKEISGDPDNPADTGMNGAFNTAHPNCRKPTVKFKDKEGQEQSAKLDLDKLMTLLKDHNDAKEAKTSDPDGTGPEMSKVEEKKDNARMAVGC